MGLYLGAQFTLVPATDRYVSVILDAVAAARDLPDVRLETDDLSTLAVGTLEGVTAALRTIFVAAAGTGEHVVASLLLSRGCPGEPDEGTCASAGLDAAVPAATVAPDALAEGALTRFTPGPRSGVHAAAQLALLPMGDAAYMDRILACIAFLKRSGLETRPRHFVTRIDGDAGAVFAAIATAFATFAPREAHVVVPAIVSANSPSAAPDSVADRAGAVS